MNLHPIIFLDADGVLNTPETWADDSALTAIGPIDHKMVDRVVQVAKGLDVRIVISAASRIVHTRETFLETFGNKLDDVLAEGDSWRTDQFPGLRGEECAVWLDNHGWRPYVCVDDNTDFYRFQPFVQVDPKVGLTMANADQIHGLLVVQQFEGVWHAGVRLQHSDMLDSENIIVAHGCNAQGAMGSGAALAVITKYPRNKKTYVEHHRKHGLKLGQVVWHLELDKKRIIANCITQEFAGNDGRKYVDYDAISASYSSVADIALANGWGAIATCQVGSGLAGGDWSVILKRLELVAFDKGITIVVHQPDFQRYQDACKHYREQHISAADL